MTFHSGSLSLNLTKLNVMTLKVKQKAVDLASCSNLLLKMVEEVLVVVEVKAAAMALINLQVRTAMTNLLVTTAAMTLINFLVKMMVKPLVKKATALRANAFPTIRWKPQRCSRSRPVLIMTPSSECAWMDILVSGKVSTSTNMLSS